MKKMWVFLSAVLVSLLGAIFIERKKISALTGSLSDAKMQGQDAVDKMLISQDNATVAQQEQTINELNKEHDKEEANTSSDVADNINYWNKKS